MTSTEFLSPSYLTDLGPHLTVDNSSARRTSVLSNASRFSMDSGDRYGSISMGNNQINDIPIMLEEANAMPESNKNKDTKTFFQTMIPILPLWMSIFCLILNILIPGIGTCFSGFLVVCNGEKPIENHKERSRFGLLCANVTVGLCQLSTVVFLCVGWFWSVAWGIYLVQNSVQLREEEEVQRQKDLQKRTLNVLIGGGNKTDGSVNLKGLFIK